MEITELKKPSEPARTPNGSRSEAFVEVSGEAQRHSNSLGDCYVIGRTGCLQATTHHVTDRR